MTTFIKKSTHYLFMVMLLLFGTTVIAKRYEGISSLRLPEAAYTRDSIKTSEKVIINLESYRKNKEAVVNKDRPLWKRILRALLRIIIILVIIALIGIVIFMISGLA